MANKRLIIVGIGGASCSGKTLLAKHIQRALPTHSHILHQDDFAPREEDIPYSPKYGVRDWDDPSTAILWPAFRAALQHARKTGELPPGHTGHDQLNTQASVGIDPEVGRRWKEKFTQAAAEAAKRGEEIVWFIVDGFILYWDKEVVSQLDVNVFLRVPYDVLKQRREDRRTYHLHDGDVWTDPPQYFEHIVWPAYIKAHEHLFSDGDVDEGQVKPEENLLALTPGDGEAEMTRAFEASCEAMIAALRAGKGRVM